MRDLPIAMEPERVGLAEALRRNLGVTLGEESGAVVVERGEILELHGGEVADLRSAHVWLKGERLLGNGLNIYLFRYIDLLRIHLHEVSIDGRSGELLSTRTVAGVELDLVAGGSPEALKIGGVLYRLSELECYHNDRLYDPAEFEAPEPFGRRETA